MPLSGSIVSGALRGLVDLALPPRCPGCGSEDVDSDAFCQSCWDGLDLLGPPQCDACGIPLPGSGEQNQASCGACLAQAPAHAGIFAAVRYADLPGDLAMRLKYGRKTGLARRMAQLMHRILPAHDRFDDPFLVPVPLHRWRLWRRGFNQAVLIGEQLSQRTGHRMLVDALVRTRSTRPLKGMNARERAREVQGAIAVNPRRIQAIAGRDILLVDDVLTSGATTMAAVEALKQAGARRVGITAFARVLD